MADPLRRTLLAKLRGKRSKKGATIGGAGGGYDPAAATAYGGREGNNKVVFDNCERAPVVYLSKLDCATERMSTYENCSVEGALLHTGTGGVVFVATTPELSQKKPTPEETRCSDRRNDEHTGVSLQRDIQLRGHVFRDSDVRHQKLNKVTLVAGGKQFVSRQCSGDSIGFGDSSRPVIFQSLQSNAGVAIAQGKMGHIDVVQNSLIFDSNTTLDISSLPLPVHPEEHILIHSIESYEPEFAGGDFRGPALQSPTFFPTELEICDLNMASMCGTQKLDSEDDDYYDNEILPFYETVKSHADKVKDKGEVSDSAMQETDRLRNQLQEAYYLLINAMNDINMDVQQVNGTVTEQQVMSSCSSHSRDSLCSRLSAKNMDSDSWSSGGEQSPQQVSDTESLLLCVNENFQRSKCDSKSMVNLNYSLMAVVLQRSASDGAIRYPGGPLVCRTQKEEGSTEATVSRDKVTAGVGEISEGQVFYDAASGDEQQREANEDQSAPLQDSSGSTNSLTGSTDSNTDTRLKSENKQGLTSSQTQACVTNKGHGVTVNKMQEWMHKGRLLSSEMKQRIEGSSPPLPRTKVQDKSATPSKKAKSPTIKSPRQPPSSAQPGRTSSRSGSETPLKIKTLLDYCRHSSSPPLIIVRLVVVRPRTATAAADSPRMQSKKGTRLLRPLCFPYQNSLLTGGGVGGVGGGFSPSH